MSWPLVPLSQVAEVNPCLPKGHDENQQVSFLGMASVSAQGEIISEETRVLAETKKGFTYFERGDVLLAKITPCFENGKAVHANGLKHPIGYGSTEFHVLRSKNGVLDAKYMFYMVWSNQFRFLGGKAMKGAAGQKRVSADFLKEFNIPLPPLAEQKRIAAILDKADSLRRKNQQAIQLADQFLRAVFLDLFGDPLSWTRQSIPLDWKEQPIGKIAHLKRGYDLPVQSRNVGKIPIYAANGVVGYHDEAKTQGPGVITGRSGTLGTVMYSKRSYWPLNTSLYVTDFFGNEPRYIQWFLQFYKLDRYNRGAGVPTLNRNLFLEEISFVPPKELQVKFVKIFDKVSAILSKVNASSGVELFDSLSQKAFAGEL